jgi:hypothetical protein
MEAKKVTKKVDPEVKRANLSFLQLIFPSFLLVLIPNEFGSNVLYPLLLKVLIFSYQYFLVKNFVDSVYN